MILFVLFFVIYFERCFRESDYHSDNLYSAAQMLVQKHDSPELVSPPELTYSYRQNKVR